MTSAATPTRRRLPPAERREQLLACAVRAFARLGIGEAGHADVARDADVAVSTVFVYFPSREALVEAVLDEVARILVLIAQTVHQDDSPASEALKAHIGAFLAFVEDNPDLAKVWMDWSTSFRQEIWPRYERLQERIVRVIANTIARGQRDGMIDSDRAPEDLARLLVSSAHMLAQLKVMKREPELTGFVAAVLEGLGVPTNS